VGNRHLDFANESEYTRYCVSLFSQGLSGMAEGAFELKPSAEAKEEDFEISEAAATSILRPIQDGPDYCEEHGRSAAIGSGGPAPG
jgi:hypothetical protein